MAKYGRLLTGREFAKSVAQTILSEKSNPVVLDFQDVLSMGSSFAEEILPPIAARQNNKLYVANINSPLRSVIKDVAEGRAFSFEEVEPSAP